MASRKTIRRPSKTKMKKEKNESPVEVAFRRVKEMMYRGELAPGQKLFYQDLAKKFNMSATPVIQALNRLCILNIVYTEKNKGFYVGETNLSEAEELFTAREALEVYMVPILIKKLNQKKLNTLRKVMKEHLKVMAEPHYRRSLLFIDVNFHLKMVEFTDNKVMYNLCKTVLEQIYLKYRPEYVRDLRISEATEEHKRLFGALKEKDIQKSQRLLKQHIRNGKKNLLESLRLSVSLEF